MTVAAVVAALGSQPQPAAAAPIITVDGPTNPLGPDLDVFTFSFNGNGVTEIDVLEFQATSDVGFNQLETERSIFSSIPDSGDTDFLGSTTVGQGLVVLGGRDTASEMNGAFARMGENLGDFNDLFAQLVVPSGTGGTFTVRFAGGGQAVFEDDWLYGVPYGNHVPSGDTSPFDMNTGGDTSSSETSSGETSQAESGETGGGGTVAGETGSGPADEPEAPVIPVSDPAPNPSEPDPYPGHEYQFGEVTLLPPEQIGSDPSTFVWRGFEVESLLTAVEDGGIIPPGALTFWNGVFINDAVDSVQPVAAVGTFDIQSSTTRGAPLGQVSLNGGLDAGQQIPEPGSQLLASLGLCAVAARRGRQ